MNAAERITALAQYFHTSVKALSELCGYERPQVFYDIQKGKTRTITPTLCDRIMAVFPDLNRVWLLTGEGPMIAPKTTDEIDAAEPDATVKMVPLVQVSALAGPLQAYYQEGEDFSRSPRIYSPAPNAEIAVPVTGDSMEPLIHNGSYLFVKRINEAAFIPWGQPMVIDTDNGVYIKNILPDSDDDAYIWAESINDRYPPMHVPKSSIHAIYRVLAIVQGISAM